MRASEQDRDDVKAAREDWLNWQEQSECKPGRLVFLDETCLNTRLSRKYGRSPKGERCISKVPHGHWHTSTFIGALRSDGLGVPIVFNGAMTGDMFLAYIEQELCPTLRPGDIVICDNLSSHKVAGVAEAIAKVGATIRYLPPYSPDLNPIELAFSKLKAHLREYSPRTFDDLLKATANALSRFKPEHCAGWFRHAQYATF